MRILHAYTILLNLISFKWRSWKLENFSLSAAILWWIGTFEPLRELVGMHAVRWRRRARSRHVASQYAHIRACVWSSRCRLKHSRFTIYSKLSIFHKNCKGQVASHSAPFLQNTNIYENYGTNGVHRECQDDCALQPYNATLVLEQQKVWEYICTSKNISWYYFRIFTTAPEQQVYLPYLLEIPFKKCLKDEDSWWNLVSLSSNSNIVTMLCSTSRVVGRQAYWSCLALISCMKVTLCH